jgi:hypothetical protein
MIYKFFTAQMTREEIKAKYRELAKRWHPDLGGDTATMQAINAEYAWAMDAATRTERPDANESTYQWHAANNETLRQKIEEAVRMFARFTAIEIEICGAWIWIHGTAKRGTSPENDAVIDLLKAHQYRFAAHKALWYYPVVPSKSHSSHSMEEIRSMYGSQFVKTGQQQHQQPTEEIAA